MQYRPRFVGLAARPRAATRHAKHDRAGGLRALPDGCGARLAARGRPAAPDGRVPFGFPRRGSEHVTIPLSSPTFSTASVKGRRSRRPPARSAVHSIADRMLRRSEPSQSARSRYSLAPSSAWYRMRFNTGSAGHTGVSASSRLTFHSDHSMRADQHIEGRSSCACSAGQNYSGSQRRP